MSKNLSKKLRDDLLQRISRIKDNIKGIENETESLNDLNIIEQNIKKRKYGLVFEEHEEKIDELLKTHLPIIKEEQVLEIKNDGEQNFLVEGDNLAALQLLNKTHKGKIKLIYIDPPYNRGTNDFIYDDNYIDKEDTFRHSKWLSFMNKRLRLAKNLLQEEGLIFISIDDNEIASLKLLCDQIFGENNFKGQISRATGTPTGQGNDTLVNEIDYILVYSKRKASKIKGRVYNEEDIKIYNQEDEFGKYLTRTLRKTGKEDRREDRPTMWFEVEAPDGTRVLPYGPTGYESRWRCKAATYEKLKQNNLIEWKYDKEGHWKPYQKFYFEGKLKQVSNLWVDIEGNKKATRTLKEIIGDNNFDNPKPVELIKQIIKISTDEEDIILDFFAGSGTTGQAVLEINEELGTKHKFILVTNNQNNICKDITYQRAKNILQGYSYKGKKENLLYEQKINITLFKDAEKVLKIIEKIKKTEEANYSKLKTSIIDNHIRLYGINIFGGFKEGLKGSLKYYKIDYLNVEDKLFNEYSGELTKNMVELVQLENFIDIKTESGIKILQTEQDLKKFFDNAENYQNINTLYINNDLLLSIEQQELIKENNILLKTIPTYYFTDIEEIK